MLLDTRPPFFIAFLFLLARSEAFLRVYLRQSYLCSARSLASQSSFPVFLPSKSPLFAPFLFSWLPASIFRASLNSEGALPFGGAPSFAGGHKPNSVPPRLPE